MSSAERTAPPGSGAASSTVTLQPRSASMLAATRPFGPAPITTASGMRFPQCSWCAWRAGSDATRVHVVVDARVTLDFERRVLDPEPLGEHRLQLARALLRVVQAQRTGEHHVRRQRRTLGTERPHVEMMHRLDARPPHRARRSRSPTSISDGAASSSTRVVSRSRRHAANTMSAAMNSDAIESSLLRVEHERADRRHDHRERAERVEREVPERGAQVEVAVRGAAEHERAARR